MQFDLVPRVLFPRPPPTYGMDSFPGELVWVPRSLNPQTSSPEDCIPLCLLQCRGARYLIIYIHSNFEDIGRCRSFCLALRYHLRVHVHIVEYPGYGISPGGQCDEQGATESARVALRFAHEVLRWPWSSIILMGRSIGTGPAVALSVKQRFAGLVLICPFLSVRELCREYIGAAAGLVRERFPNGDLISQVRSPCLIVHGLQDSTIPHRHGQQLFEACTSRKRLVAPPDMEHNSDLLENEAYLLGPMREFFGLPGAPSAEMQVPSWAFDKQFAPGFAAMRRSASCPPDRDDVGCGVRTPQQLLVARGGAAPRTPATCFFSLGQETCAHGAGCRGCQGAPALAALTSSPCAQPGAGDAWMVEETIVGAVEYRIHEAEEELITAKAGLVDDPAFERRMAHILRRAEEVAGRASCDASLSAQALRAERQWQRPPHWESSDDDSDHIPAEGACLSMPSGAAPTLAATRRFVH